MAARLLVVLEERTAHRLRGQLGAQERVQFNGWSVEDWSGVTAIDLARDHGQHEIVALLEAQLEAN